MASRACRGRGFDSHRDQKIFSLPRVVPCFPLLGLTPCGLFMGLSSTLIYTSELILCFTICVPSATRHNIHIYKICPLCYKIGTQIHDMANLNIYFKYIYIPFLFSSQRNTFSYIYLYIQLSWTFTFKPGWEDRAPLPLKLTRTSPEEIKTFW